jgi:hypothetical protein
MAMNFEGKLHNFEDFEVGGKMCDKIDILNYLDLNQSHP